jgi:hypothetical protein
MREGEDARNGGGGGGGGGDGGGGGGGGSALTFDIETKVGAASAYRVQ